MFGLRPGCPFCLAESDPAALKRAYERCSSVTAGAPCKKHRPVKERLWRSGERVFKTTSRGIEPAYEQEKPDGE